MTAPELSEILRDEVRLLTGLSPNSAGLAEALDTQPVFSLPRSSARGGQLWNSRPVTPSIPGLRNAERHSGIPKSWFCTTQIPTLGTNPRRCPMCRQAAEYRCNRIVGPNGTEQMMASVPVSGSAAVCRLRSAMCERLSLLLSMSRISSWFRHRNAFRFSIRGA